MEIIKAVTRAARLAACAAAVAALSNTASAQGSAETSAGGLEPILAKCSKPARRSFLESLTFVKGRMASAHVKEVRKCLDAKNYDSMLEFFKVKGTDHDSYWCSSRATCSKKTGSICTGNCRSSGDEDIATYVYMRDVLKGHEKKDRDGFLDSLAFEDGRLLSADFSILRKSAKAKSAVNVLCGKFATVASVCGETAQGTCRCSPKQ